jgi:hypothetical protein
VVVSVAVLTLVSLSLLAWTKLAAPPAVAAGPAATMGGLRVEVSKTEWAPMNMVMDGRGGFVMPDDMMPGAPESGRVRLGVGVTLVNTRSGTETFDLPGEFTITGGLETEAHPLAADTIGELSRLGPGSAMQGTLYFDLTVPADPAQPLPPLYLQWSRDGDAVRIPVQLPGGEMPEHHGH